MRHGCHVRERRLLCRGQNRGKIRKREDVLMKSNVPRQKGDMRVNIQQFIPFESKGVSKKDKPSTLRIKLLSTVGHCSGKRETTEYSKVAICGLGVKKKFKRGFIIENGCGGSVNEVNRSQDAVRPIFEGEVGLKTEGSCDIE